ncbi:hypothetical protein BTI_5123 [Burkholderia thailandensis MSMB121]|uniref:DUF4180 domain-containing protein n=1 Tax=Burkholderia humptydooensis TaxID=430531 RepID=UPI000327F3FA|nr:DUF4180 domain-containing protein [Burkholderia humptydooensis]AGK51071.1 hypothetical protein BTI_5123 [Burkholderia thailandensis MSMB121]ATF33414.1 DUF4180 domain-containing protein [Burkholderia thailandensis]KST71493.1 hypothetical protein WS76_23350 [Burkholderia humptydooensis]
MKHERLTVGDVRVLRFDAASAAPLRDGAAETLLAAAWEHDAAWVAVAAEHLHDDFFRLDTRVAGHLVQKLINYRVKLAVVGNIDAALARSRAAQRARRRALGDA